MKTVIKILCNLFAAIIIFYFVVIYAPPKSYPELHENVRPYGQGYAKWVSKSPEIYFVAYYEQHDKYWDIPIGIMKIEEKLIPVVILFDDQSGVRFKEDNKGDRYEKERKEYIKQLNASKDFIVGECIFSTDKLTVYVSETEGQFFKGETLKFERISLEDEAQLP